MSRETKIIFAVCGSWAVSNVVAHIFFGGLGSLVSNVVWFAGIIIWQVKKYS